MGDTLRIGHSVSFDAVDWGDGLRPWETVFAAGYPDSMLDGTMSLPVPKPGLRWVWTGRKLVPWPTDQYGWWMGRLWSPVSLDDLARKSEEVFGPGRTMVADLLRAGLFVIWPFTYQIPEDSPDGLALQPRPQAENPLPGVIPSEKWASGRPIPLSGLLYEMWERASDRGTDLGFADAVQAILRGGSGWLVARSVLS